MFKAQLLRGLHALLQGGATGASATLSFLQTTNNVTLAVTAGGLLLTADFLNNLYFFGKRIVDNCRKKSSQDQEPDFAKENSNEKAEPLLIEKPAESKTSEEKEKPTCSSYAKQTSYLSLDLAKNLSNRYFLFSTLANIFKLGTATSPVLWSFLGFTLIFKQLFSMSNETFETAAEMSPSHEPFFSNIFKCCSPRSLKVFKTWGCVDHTIIDDLLVWFGFLPENTLDFLSENPYYWSLSAPVAIIFWHLAIRVYRLTNFVEGSSTEENICKALKLSKQDEVKFTPEEAKRLQRQFYILGPIHGGQNAFPIYSILLWLLQECSPLVKYSSAITGAFVAFAITSLGTHKAEVLTALKKIDECTERTLSLPPPTNSVNSMV